MKAVMISIQPKWIEKIVNGEKTIELRKTMPKLEPPFKCYIYCTKGKPIEQTCFEQYTCHIGNGKVIGEFICDYVYKYKLSRLTFDYYIDELKTKSHAEYNGIKKCLTSEEMFNYGKGKPLYGWHISDLEIYDEPKEINEFWTVKCSRNYKTCFECKDKPNCIKTISRPFQSWGYVEI